MGAAFQAHSRTEHSQPSRKDGAVLFTWRGVRKGRNQGGRLDFGFEYQRTVIPSTELRGPGRKAGLRPSFWTSQVSDDDYTAKQMGGLPLGGRGQSRWGTGSATMSAQTERGERLPEKEPGQTRAEDRALGPQHQRPRTEAEPGRSRGRRSKRTGENRGESGLQEEGGPPLISAAPSG